jgi:hypothetical protein
MPKIPGQKNRAKKKPGTGVPYPSSGTSGV